MTVYTWNDILQFYANKQIPPQFALGTALSVGSFDGPHSGHKALFNAVTHAASEHALIPGVVTFTHPLSGLKHRDDYMGDVSSLEQRLEALKQSGMSFSIVIDFSDEFARMEGQLFFSILCTVCNLQFLAEGKDFHCGYKGATNIAAITSFAEANHFELAVVPPVLYQNERVSSSKIRTDVLEGNLSAVHDMLGRNFAVDCSLLQGTVTTDESGSSWFTIENTSQVLPPDGIYTVLLKMSGSKHSNAADHAAKADDIWRTTVLVESRTLRLKIVPDIIMSHIQIIEFIVGE